MTELIWEGKYDRDGRKVAPLRIALPFQTVEIVTASMQRRQGALDISHAGRDPEWRNRLIRGDTRYVLPSLLPEFAGKVDLIYIDPPFDTGADFSFTTAVPSSTGSPRKNFGGIEQKAYRDTWGRGLDSYLQWFYETVALLRDLLADDGSLYVHLDWRVAHYAKAVLDELFSERGFQNEIVWCYREAINSTKRWNRKHDTLLFYSKDPEKYCFNANAVLQPHSQVTIAKYRYQDETGRYRLMGRGITGSPIQSARDISPEWEKTQPELVYRHYLREGSYAVDYWNIDIINQASYERLNYPTQKPEALLERIVKASSREGDLILDCFCGSGTTAAVAEKLGRRWITCDLGRFAIHTTRKRLLGIPDVKSFVVQNLGKYERQAWQRAEFGEQAAARIQAYRCSILDLYRAHPFPGYTWLHGAKEDRLVYVASVDAPVSLGDVAQIASEFRRVLEMGPALPGLCGVDVLGWEFAFDIEEVARHQPQAAIPMRFIYIPREALEKKAVEQGDIRFFELGTLGIEAQLSGRSVTLRLTEFVVPRDALPPGVRGVVTHWEQWIDYWAVDWDNRGEPFHNRWQAYRTRKNKGLQIEAAHTYSEPGEYRILVHAVDLLGNDATRKLEVSVN